MDFKLRSLKIEDIEYMFEFIEDEEISSNFIFTRYPYSKKKMIDFIKESWESKENLHYAIEVNKEYAGTVSLKNINYIDRHAEYAIVLRKKYWGMGISTKATGEILKYGFNAINLNKIYLNVLSTNKRAIRFYEKFGFKKKGFLENMYILTEDIVI
ncbi:GNAT family N-acetyltransferase [Marinitoga lauensis]|uniref:GNAT family N-acetyltransferase n=1 Tax=Marinitoga lauensis TaxID=2201189 RepID=UPI001010B0FE|nr:GNAT family N-acetyltransferase [Marinitoga lauensis]